MAYDLARHAQVYSAARAMRTNPTQNPGASVTAQNRPEPAITGISGFWHTLCIVLRKGVHPATSLDLHPRTTHKRTGKGAWNRKVPGAFFLLQKT
jgi:hypothetical protein